MRHKEFEDDLVLAARVQRHLEPSPTVWGRVRVDTFSLAPSVATLEWFVRLMIST
jgi:hypothetical protein